MLIDDRWVWGGCRYLVETPANICTPKYLADTAGRIRDLAPERFQLTVHERAAVEEMNMGLYLGAQTPPEAERKGGYCVARGLLEATPSARLLPQRGIALCSRVHIEASIWTT